MANLRRPPPPRVTKAKGRPAATPEERENQLINLAYDLVEERFRAGTASATETTLFLKMGTTRESLEQARLRNENELLQAKVRDMEEKKNILELYDEAIAAMRSYQGVDEDYYG